MKRIIATILLCAPLGLLHAAEPAADDKDPPWTSETWVATMKAMPKGDIGKGKALYTEGYCVSCHGDAGVPLTEGAPTIAGQDPFFTYKALLDYQRAVLHIDDKSLVMIAAATPMTEQDMADLGAYLGSLPRPQKIDDPTKLPGHDIARMCRGCHGQTGLGGKNHAGPALAGLNPFYLKRQLEAFQTGRRHNEINYMMFNIMGTWSQKQIDDLVAYYSAL